MFTLGCNNLIAFIDHYPLHGFFSNRELSNISNPRICNLKEKTMKYHFKIRYNSGKWHHGLDACSQNPAQLNTFLKWYGGPQFIHSSRTGDNSHQLNFIHSSRTGDFIKVIHQWVIHNPPNMQSWLLKHPKDNQK